MKQTVFSFMLPAIFVLTSACSDNNADDSNPSGSCCPGDELHIWVKGVTYDINLNPIGVAYAPIAPLHALYSDTPRKLITGQSDATTGAFESDCFDVESISLGLVILTDDMGFDETDGDYYPTATGILSWDTDEEKTCVDDAVVFAVTTDIIETLETQIGMDMTVDGVAMGLVLDAEGNPVSGATIKQDNGSDLPEIYYPNSALNDFSATETTSAGLYVIPGPLPEDPDPTVLMPVKEGLTFKAVGYKAGSQKSFCYFLRMQALSE